MKLLVDECLSEELTKLAQRRGHAKASHVTGSGNAVRKDWQLKRVILDGDWTFVTKNSIDFRGSHETPGSGGQCSDVIILAGLICLNGPVGMDLDLQLEMFEEALNDLDRNKDLVNEVLEVSVSDSGEEFVVTRYKMPPEGI